MTTKIYIKRYAIFLSVISLIIFSCKNQNKENDTTINEVQRSNDKVNRVEVVTNAMDFEIPSQFDSGWTTFEYINKSEETHFFILEKMPEGITIENYNNELVPPFKKIFTFLIEGKNEEAMKASEEIPEWWKDVKLGGGVGLISPQSSAQSTVFLNPGTYVMECYVRMPNGMPHAFYGMLKQIVVTDKKNNLEAPIADYNIDVSSEKGIVFKDSIKSGVYELAVNFKDQKLYETLLGHDINLVRLDKLSNLDSLGDWINAANIQSFRTPTPEGLTFLGGVEDLEAGSTGFFKANLAEKGNYVLISEIPDVLNRKMYKVFKVY
ncbi:hypothetical protein V8G61_12070 [Gaetbulibacter sp. M240]|uniref:hypothetical protein n=1 Tax=Gaetbulibacter sp. M240 TaxID=3126511 RepID=UPI00374EDD92